MLQTHSSTEASQGIVRDGAHNNPGSRSQAGNQGQPGQAFLNLPFQAMHQLQLPLQRAAAAPSLQMVMIPVFELSCYSMFCFAFFFWFVFGFMSEFLLTT